MVLLHTSVTNFIKIMTTNPYTRYSIPHTKNLSINTTLQQYAIVNNLCSVFSDFSKTLLIASNIFNTTNTISWRNILSLFNVYWLSIGKLTVLNNLIQITNIYTKAIYTAQITLLKISSKDFPTPNYLSRLGITFKNVYIRFNPSTIAKNVYKTITGFSALYLRKVKIFSKGRYSRNRQFYRTGVYWCLYINIIAVVGFYYWFYRFIMNFGYLWWLFYLSINVFVCSKMMSLHLFTIKGFHKVVNTEIRICLNIVLLVRGAVWAQIQKYFKLYFWGLY